MPQDWECSAYEHRRKGFPLDACCGESSRFCGTWRELRMHIARGAAAEAPLQTSIRYRSRHR